MGSRRGSIPPLHAASTPRWFTGRQFCAYFQVAYGTMAEMMKRKQLIHMQLPNGRLRILDPTPDFMARLLEPDVALRQEYFLRGVEVARLVGTSVFRIRQYGQRGIIRGRWTPGIGDMGSGGRLFSLQEVYKLLEYRLDPTKPHRQQLRGINKIREPLVQWAAEELGAIRRERSKNVVPVGLTVLVNQNLDTPQD